MLSRIYLKYLNGKKNFIKKNLMTLKVKKNKNGYRIYVDSLTLELRLLIWTLFVDQFFHPIGVDGMG